MTLESLRKPFTFSDGRTIVVSEFEWDMSMRLSAIKEQARQDRARLNGTGDALLLYFQEEIYSYLAACSAGDVPDPQPALELSEDDLDNWFFIVRELNPQMFDPYDGLPGQVEFRDGSQLTIVSAYNPSSLLRAFRLDLSIQAQIEQGSALPEHRMYAKMASCSRGNVPIFDEARHMPQGELHKWFAAVLATNPKLFQTTEQVVAADQVTEKKSKRHRGR